MRNSATFVHTLAVSVVLLLGFTVHATSSANDRDRLSIDETSINADAHAWSSKGGALLYATSDGSVWSRSRADLATPVRITNIALPKEQKIEQIVWSPDGQSVAIVSPRLNDLWDTIWLVNLKTSALRDLLPPGAPFGGPGIRALRISTWSRDGRILFVEHCGTGCLGLHGVQSQTNERYWDFCDASGELFWSPAGNVAVVQNDHEGIAPVGLGLVSISDGTEVAKGASYYRPRRECTSVFEGADLRSQAQPHFDSWFPDGKTVLYTDAGLNSTQLKLWDTLTGSRRTFAANGESGVVSPDGRYICFVAPEHEKIITWRSKRVLLRILDSQSERIVASKEIPAVRPRGLWSPSIVWSPSSSCLAILARDGKLLFANLKPDGIGVLQTKVAGQDLSWSPDGQYLAIREAVSRLKILKCHSDVAPSTSITF